MIAVDTNILLYAHRDAFPQHRAARGAIKDLAEGHAPWAIPLFAIAEFLRVATHPRVIDPPTKLNDAVAFIDALVAIATARLLVPTETFWPTFRDTAVEAKVKGNLVFDAQIVALCRENGADEILSEDRDLRRFPGISVRGWSPDAGVET